MTDDRRRIVILGGGYGGAYCAQALEKRLGARDVDVLLIDRNNYFVVYPLLIEAGTGSLEPRHAVVSIRAFLRRTAFCMAEVVGVDVDAGCVSYRLVGREELETVAFDHLVVALGSVTRLPPIPGLREHGFEMKSLVDAVALRDRAIAMLELANAAADEAARRALLHLVVIGGNFTGVELAGEFDMFLRQASCEYPNVVADDCRVTLVELSDRILRALDEDLSDFATRHLRRRGVDVRLETSVTEVRADGATLSTGETLNCHTLICCAGIAPNPLIAEMNLPVDDHGYILCDRALRVRGLERVWAIGDGAVNLDAGGNAYPATAQHAVRQGARLARNLARVLDGRQPTACDIRTAGTLAALGCRTGVAKVMGVKLAGFWAWWLWRSVYLLKMPTMSRRARVALDWTLDLLFRREYVQLGLHRLMHQRAPGSPSGSKESEGRPPVSENH